MPAARKPIVLLAVAAVLSGLLFGLAWLRRPSEAPRKAAMEDLLRRGDKMHYRAEENPFTGFMLERYASGQLKSRSFLLDGVLHGVSEGWYRNGVLQVREHFENGVSHGLRTRWSEKGQKISESPIVNGQVSGTYRRWHANGRLAEEIEMVQGQPHGISRGYYESGNLEVEARLEMGKVVERQRWKDGEAPASQPSFVSK